MSKFLNKVIKRFGDDSAAIVADGLISDVTGFTDTGSMIFNALLSGSLYGGMPNNKILAIAGEQATGKTYFTMGIIAKFLQDNKNGEVIYFDTEQAVTSDMFISRGVDGTRVAVIAPQTVEEFRHKALTILDDYLAEDESERVPILMVLDSLGNLPTSKEINDAAEGKEVRDMTRAQLIKSTFRVLTIKLGNAKVPMIMTNHTYDVVGSYVPTKEMGGGSGLKYAASTIVYLSKKKDKDGDGEVVGNIINCKLYKSRFTKPEKVVSVKLNYETGLDRYYGLVDLALESGVFVKNSTRITLPDGSSAFEKNIYENPDKYFTKETLEKLEEAAGKEFKYGSNEH